MLTRSKLLFAALAAAAMMLSMVANASARNFSLSEREFEILWRELAFRTSSNTISCPITLLGRFVENTIPKIVGTQVGAIRHAEPLNGAEPNPCTGGSITILNSTLPWLIFYQGFTGRLPEIERIRLSLIRVSFRVRTSNGIGCLAGTTAAEPAFGEVLINNVGGTRGRVEELRADETRAIRLGGGFLCSLAGTSTFAGTGFVLNLPGTRRITVTLI